MTDPARQQLPFSVAAKSVRVTGDTGLAAAAVGLLQARQVICASGPASPQASDELLAYITRDTIGPAMAMELIHRVVAHSPMETPMVVLSAPVTGDDQAAREQAAALAYLRSYGAVVTSDPDVWLEAIVLLTSYPLPTGAQVALIAPPDTWLSAQALTLHDVVTTRTWDSVSAARSALRSDARNQTTDIVLFEYGTSDIAVAAATGDSIWVPVVARLESWPGRTLSAGTLVGVRCAIGASMLVGAAAQRISAGVGPAPSSVSVLGDVDQLRVAKQLERIFETDTRIGDHETKALLASYGVAITRQAVATTASSALRIAKRAGFPVEIKPWGPDVASEVEGCPIETNLTTGADVRRGFAAVLTALGRSQNEEEGAAVIVRESAPRGRELQAVITQLPQLGWTVLVTGTGHVVPLAAPAPLRAIDAATLALQLLASRASESQPDRAALAQLLERASHLAVDQTNRFARLTLSRIVVGGRGERTLVVDAWIELRAD